MHARGGAMSTERAAEAARTQALLREVNERIRLLNEAFAMVLPVGEWVCECADRSCVESFELLTAEYEAVRADPTRFLVLPGHELEEVERVVKRYGSCVVIEKNGGGAEIAVAAAARASGSAAA